MVYITVCDDEPGQREYLRACVNNWARNKNAGVNIDTHESAESYMFARGQQPPADILLLDIQMKGMDGVQLARKLREINDGVQIIFITGYADYMAEGYDVSALHYLMKPVNEEKLCRVLDRALARLENISRTVLIQTPAGMEKIPVEEILCVEAFAHYISIQTENGTFETRANIGEFEKELGEGFIRSHRSYIINLRKIIRITKTDAMLVNQRAVPLSRRMYAEVNRKFIEINKRE